MIGGVLFRLGSQEVELIYFLPFFFPLINPFTNNGFTQLKGLHVISSPFWPGLIGCAAFFPSVGYPSLLYSFFVFLDVGNFGSVV